MSQLSVIPPMSLHVEKFLENIEFLLPHEALITSKDLVDAGVVRSESTLGRWRSQGIGPAFIKFSPGQVKYIRASVLEWLRDKAFSSQYDHTN